MGIKSLIIENSADILNHLDRRILSEKIIENVGRVKNFEFAKNFYVLNNVEGVDTWSKSEKNLFAMVMSKHPYKDLVLKEYNTAIKKNNKFEDKKVFFKQLSTFNELMQVYPYNEPNFARSMISGIFKMAIAKENTNIKLLQSGMSLYVDTKILNNLANGEDKKQSDAMRYLEMYQFANKKSKIKNINTTSIAGLTAVSYLLMNPEQASDVNDIMKTVADTASELVAGADTWIKGSNTVLAALTAYFIYKTVDMFQGVLLKYSDLVNGKRVLLVNPEKVSQQFAANYLSQQVLGSLIQLNPFEITNKENKNYLALAAFANEKLSNPSITVPVQMATDLGLNTNQIDKLNKLNQKQIQKIVMTKSPSISKVMMTEKMSDEQENALLELSVLHQIKMKKETSGLYFSTVKDIGGVSKDLKKEYDKLGKVDKQLVNSYIKLHTDTDNVCPSSILESLEKSLKRNVSVVDIVNPGIQKAYSNEDKEVKSTLIDYIQKVGGWIFKKDEKYETVNSNVKSTLAHIANEYSFSSVELVSKKNRAPSEYIADTKSKAIENMKKLKNKLLGTSTIPTPPSP